MLGIAAVGLASACVPGSSTPLPTPVPTPRPTSPPPTAQAPAPTVPPTTAPAAKVSGKIKLGWVAVSAANSAIWSADAGGYLTKYGIDYELSGIQNSPQAVPAILSGEIPLNCGISSTDVIASVLQGADLTFLAVTINTFPSSIMGQPGLDSPQALKGARIGVSRFGSASDTAARVYLKRQGLDPNADVTLVQIGGTNETLAAMQAGQLDAGVLSPPVTTQAARMGFTEVVDIGKLGIEYAYNGVAAQKKFIGDNPDLVENVLKALIEGAHRFKTDPEFGKSTIQKFTKVDDAQILQVTWEPFAAEYLRDRPFPTDAGMQTVLDELSGSVDKARTASPRDFYDDSVLKKLDQNGFLRTTLGG
jgi:ABC-type nitrate/sulfonate/bicarbonate transport system substrate-binding protein